MPDADTKTITRRIGRFCVDLSLLEDQTVMAQLMLSGMVIVRAQHRYDLNAIEYMALCDEFDEVPDGQEAPYYDARMNEQRVNGEDGSDGGVIRVFDGWQRRA